MGILYSVFPISDEAAEWLRSLNVEFDGSAPSRLPTGREIEEALRTLPGYQVRLSSSGIGSYWQAMVERTAGPNDDDWTLLNISKYQGPDAPNQFGFEKGSTPLILKIVQQLTHHTGSLVVYADCGGNPVVVTPNRSIEELMDSW